MNRSIARELGFGPLRKHSTGGITMGRLVATAVVLGAAYAVITSIPDIARYIKIRSM